MKKSVACLAPFVFGFAMNAVAQTEQEPIELLIEGKLRETALNDIPSSVLVKSQEAIENQGVVHFQDLMPSLPNTLYSGETTRARFLQIRGIGERSEYTGAPNNSVGTLIDGIDFSGLGGVSALFDVKQVEVLRGPQGTAFGANALAGLINVISNDPTPYYENGVALSLGQDDLRTLTGYSSGPITEAGDVNYRISFYRNEQNGFRDNNFLGRDDTNNIDETALRAKVNWLKDDGGEMKLTYYYVDNDNGYDAFALDNRFATLSDQPGEDDQQSDAAHLYINQPFESFDLISNTAYADSDIRYSYDADWVFSGFWDPAIYGYDYTAFFANDKRRRNFTQEFRLVSAPNSRLFHDTADWVTGVYYSHLDEDNSTEDTFSGVLDSDYRAETYAAFGQLDTDLTEQWLLTTGLRLEQRDAQYDDSNQQQFSPKDNLWGGQLALTFRQNDRNSYYGSISRGFKAGGVNPVVDPDFPENRREYNPETLVNYEIGWRYNQPKHGFNSRLTLFYMERKDLQVDGSEQLDNGAFIYFIENIDSGSNYGVEWEFDWRPDNRWLFEGALGLLDSQFDNYAYTPRFQEPIDLSGRDQAHAPNYQFSLATQYSHPSGAFGRLEVNGVDGFYFSNSHNQRSKAYQVVNTRIGYAKKQWEVALWGKNIFDERYATRGFFFANDPDFVDVQEYVRLGDRRQFGVTVKYDF